MRINELARVVASGAKPVTHFQSAALPTELPGRIMQQKNLAGSGGRWECGPAHAGCWCVPSCAKAERLPEQILDITPPWPTRQRTPCQGLAQVQSKTAPPMKARSVSPNAAK